MAKITPTMCRKTADKLAEPSSCDFMCCVLAPDSGSPRRRAFNRLLVEHGVPLDGQIVPWADYADHARSIRVMFLLFLALWLQDDYTTVKED